MAWCYKCPMPVNTPHPTYAHKANLWDTVQDCIDGAPAIKAGREKYLPKLKDQPDDAYDAYLTRAMFWNATGRTHEAMAGSLFRKKPTLETPIDEATLENVDLQGNSFDHYASKVTQKVTSVGRCGTLVDFNEQEGRPYLAFYQAENIVNWRTTVTDGKRVLTLLVLREFEQNSTVDEFTLEENEVYRVYKVDPEGSIRGAGVWVELWKGGGQTPRGDGRVDPASSRPATGVQSDFQLISAMQPKRRGEVLMEIPFIFHNAENAEPDIGLVPLLDIAHINVGHFRNSADIENGRHTAGVPTVWTAGFESEGKLYLGASFAWTAEDPNAKCGFLEYSGQGLGSLKEGMEEKMQQMASLGARMIEPRQADAEAYSTVAMRNTAETSALAKMAGSISNTLTKALRWIEWWDGTIAAVTDAATEFCLHKDFAAVEITPEKMNALIAAWQQNAISYETLFTQLQRGEVIAEGKTSEEEREEIEADPPMPAPVAVPIGPDGKPLEKADPDADAEDEPAPGPAAKKVAGKKAAKKAAPRA